MNLTHKQTLSQSQIISQNQVQSLNVLSMNNAELNSYLWEMQLENPVLEVTQTHTSYEEFVTLGQWFKKNDYSTSQSFTQEENESRETVFENEGIQLKDYLISQIDHTVVTYKEISLLNYLIESLDEKGYLKLTEEELVSLTQFPANAVRKCVSLLKSFDPIGIGAYDLAECLCLQARALNAEEVIITLIHDYLDDIAKTRYDRISKHLGIPIRHLKDYIRFIKQLNPIPANGFTQDTTQYIIPDIILTRQNNTWNIAINDNWIGDIKISSLYQNIATTLQDAEVLE